MLIRRRVWGVIRLDRISHKASRSTDDVKQELETERERLGDAVKTLRSQAQTARRRLPAIAAAAAATGFVLRTVAKRIRRRGST